MRRMIINARLLLTVLCMSWGLVGFSQTTGMFDNLVNSTEREEHNSVGDVNSAYVAISNQTTLESPQDLCQRELRLFDQTTGQLLAQQVYSYDHGGVTKILFDPNDRDVVYAVYIERDIETTTNPDWRTYVRRFKYDGVGNFTMSPRKEVFFTNNNICDFVVAPNSDVLIGATQSDGSVRVNAYEYSSGQMTQLNSFLVGGVGAASYGSQHANRHAVYMDMKGNDFILGHNVGSPFSSSILITKYAYNGTLTTLNTYTLSGERFHTNNSMGAWNRFGQFLALKPNGDILYLYGTLLASPWKLVKLASGGSTTVLNTGNSHANVVASDNGKSVLAYINGQGEYQIDQYGTNDLFQVTHLVGTELKDVNTSSSEGINNMSMSGCTILSCGEDAGDNENTGGDDLYYELYSCEECEENCCPENLEVAVNCEDGVIEILNIPSTASVAYTTWYYSKKTPSGESSPGQVYQTSNGLISSIQPGLDGYYSVSITFVMPNGETCHYFVTVYYSSRDCCERAGPFAVSHIQTSITEVLNNPGCAFGTIPVICEEFILRVDLTCPGEEYMVSVKPLDEINCTTPTTYPYTTGLQPMASTINLSAWNLPDGYYFMEFIVGSAPNWDWEYTVFRVNCGNAKVVPAAGSELISPSAAMQNISLFPNPSKDKVNVVLGEEATGVLTVLSIEGKMLLSANFQNQNNVDLSIADLPAGMYIVHITVGDETIAKKLLKE